MLSLSIDTMLRCVQEDAELMPILLCYAVTCGVAHPGASGGSGDCQQHSANSCGALGIGRKFPGLFPDTFPISYRNVGKRLCGNGFTGFPNNSLLIPCL